MSKATDLWGFKPNINIQAHLRHEENMVVDLSDITKSEGGQEYRILSIGTIDFYMTEKQAEQLFEELESKLYDESFQELENKYLRLKNENKKLRGLSR
ncbi:MAG TPA: hypothetical protein VFC96_04855 [Anaerovoracaceae bacterium]|nr:hypothetical protein [Anaerovoracaceae bacterium]